MKTASITARRLILAPGIIVSATEAAVLRGLVAGQSLQQIAEAEHTSRSVMSVAASRAYRKIGCPDRFSVRSRLQELGALEKLCPIVPPTAEELATELVAELQRTGRHRGPGAILILPKGAYASVCCIVRTACEPEIGEIR